MRQLIIPEAGGPDVFEMRESPDPVAGPGEVRIRVRAAGVNFADLSARMGTYQDAPPFPCCIGYEVAGVVDQLGPAASDGSEATVAVGDEVFGMTMFGGYADTVVVPAYQVRRVPAGLDLVAAAGVPVVSLTAYMMVVRLGSLRPGESILIHGVGGGVGLAALQFALDRGATVIGTASGRKHDRLRGLGVEYLIDYRTQDLRTEVRRIVGDRGVDVILDPIGGPTTRTNFKLLAPLGRLFLYGVSSTSARGARTRSYRQIASAVARTPIFHPFQLMNANKGVFGINMNRLASDVPSVTAAFDEIVDALERSVLDPIVDATFPLEGAGRAHSYLADGNNFGKVVLTV
jgi:NADPH:quinone reductase-like Zn-dependent oxidoreductase